MYTQEEVIEKFREVHGDRYDYSLVKYVNNITPVDIICKIHGVFPQIPKNHKMGQGCPECGKKYAREWSRNNYKHFLEQSKKKFGDKYIYPFIEKEYVNKHSEITIICKICNNTFKNKADYHLSTKYGGCKVCEKKHLEDRTEYFTYDDLISKKADNIILKPFDGKLSKKDKCVAVCSTHGEYEVLVSTILDRRGKCKKCNKNSKRIVNVNNFKELFETKYKQIECKYSEFKNMSSKITFVCKDCGHVFKRKPTEMLNHVYRHPCPKCSLDIISKEHTKSLENFKAEVENIYGKGTFDMTETVYSKSSEYVTLKCNKCGRYFTKEANSLLQGKGCPYHYTNHSKIEEELSSYLKSLNEIVYTNDRTILKDRHELDIYLPEHKIAIEIDGIFWHNELYKDKNYHLNKTVECNEKGIRLFHIFEDEWLNKSDIIKSMLNVLLHKNINTIFARNCKIIEPSIGEVKQFLSTNHIQGYCNSRYYYGLYYNNEMVSLMTFGKTRHFIGASSHEYELLRFCSKLNTIVIGGASKLLKYFTERHKPKSIVSYADRRWSNGHLYNKLGFIQYGISKPNYYYVINGQRKNRFNFRKGILMKKYNCPQDISEHEFCKSMGWYRIYDCGQFCFELKTTD